MTVEEKYIVEQFQINFANSEKKIAIYGIGKNTKLILDAFPGAPVVGLMDASTKETTLFGKKLLSNLEIVGNVDIILIVARKAVQSIIYPRIKKYAKSGIKIMDIEGNEISDEEYIPCMIPEWEIAYGDIIKQIDKYECISFDLFDTLIARKFLIPLDVFETVIRHNHISEGEELIKARDLAEKEGKALKSIDDIYKAIGQKCNRDNSEIEKLKALEIEMEKNCVVPRRKVMALLKYAREQGKKIFILSDMYYGKKELCRICGRAGIEVYENEIISSCEIKATKEDGTAFDFLKDFAGTDSILHIGDNKWSDYLRAKEAGLEAIHILSGYEMLLHSSLGNILVDTKSYEKRCLLALAITKLFNDPFVLGKFNGKIHITDCEEFGYVWGIVLYSFLCWLIEQTELYGINQLILPGRDGYLIEKALKFFNPKFDYKYIVASRRAYELALVSDRDKVREIIANNFKGNIQDLYKVRFNIDLSDIGEAGDDNIALILEQATYQRKCLLDYFEKTGICNKGKITEGGRGF